MDFRSEFSQNLNQEKVHRIHLDHTFVLEGGEVKSKCVKKPLNPTERSENILTCVKPRAFQ